ncbi:MAG: tetratricopeptide repeat protein [Chitinophagaceae bacterium]|nr:tetratricopeptide repeat protein [Chitinophagaceae bacterium]MCW5914318.1 tetratricopeptide repeat protein [Chitinophagaceae bacterium]MCZ2395573.1 tetratricopeptide repeat protein [Chitinophagales bacterium]
MKAFPFFLLFAFLSLQGMAQSDSVAYYLASGKQKMEAGLNNAASIDFAKALEFDPQSVEALIANGNVNMKMYRLYEAEQSFKKASEIQPGNKELTKSLMNLSFNARQHKKAIELAEKCDCEESDRIIGISYYRMENYGKALTYLQNALKKNESDAEAVYTMARTYMELEHTKEMLAYYAKAVTLAPEKGYWHYELALLYYNADDFKNSLKEFELARNNGYRESNDFIENYGFCLLYAGEKEAALKTLADVLERKANNPTLLADIAYGLYLTKHYKDAISFYDKLLKANPTDASSMYMAGMAFQKMGEKQKGQAICDKAIEMNPALAKNRQKKEMPMGL